MSLLIEYIKFLLEKRATFNPNAIKDMDPEQLLTYVKKYEYIAQGTSRRVYFISPGKVLKVARNVKGIAQNKAELEIYNKTSNKDYFTKIYDSDPSNLWLLAESAREVQSNEFHNLTRISASEFEQILKTVDFLGFDEARMSLGRYTFNKFVTDTIDLMQQLDLNYGDLHYGHYGKCKDGRIALFDYGFTNEVAAKYYNVDDVPPEEDFGTKARQARCKHKNIVYDKHSKIEKYKCNDCGRLSRFAPAIFMSDCQHPGIEPTRETGVHLDGRAAGRGDFEYYYNVQCKDCGRPTKKYITTDILEKHFPNVKLVDVKIENDKATAGRQLKRYTYEINGKNYHIIAYSDNGAAAKVLEKLDPNGDFLK